MFILGETSVDVEMLPAMFILGETSVTLRCSPLCLYWVRQV